MKFGVYDVLRNKSSDMRIFDGFSNPVIIQGLCTGALAGAIAGLFTYPNDTIRRIMQMENSGGAFATYARVYWEEGLFITYAIDENTGLI